MSSPAPAGYPLTRAMRLSQKREFTRIRQEGQRLAKGCLIANWMTLPSGSLPRMGVITTRKLGESHVRSRARRLLRESFRLHQHELSEPIAVVLVARNSILGRKLCEVERDYVALLRQAKLLKTNA
jgi:ribonuclease P protein component